MFDKKYHFFYLSFSNKEGKTVGIAFRTNHAYIKDKDLHFGRQQLELDVNAPVIAVSYLGHMTFKQWNSPA